MKRKKSQQKLRIKRKYKRRVKKQKRQIRIKDNPNIIDLGKLMRKHSGGMNVSPSAVHAMASRIDLFLEISMPLIVEISKAHGCKTIKEVEDLEHIEKSQAHITWFFGLVPNKIENIAQIKKKYHWELVKNG